MSTTIADKAAKAAAQTAASIKSLVKLLLQPGSGSLQAAATEGKPLIIMGNGPSLRANLDRNMDVLCSAHTLAVNFAANAPEFSRIKPRYYVLADPHFFSSTTDENVAALMSNLNAVSWPITLYIPAGASVKAGMLQNPNITIEHFRANATEGFPWFENKIFGLQMGMPRPRNVLIPAIMIGIWIGFREIYIIGADHSWTQTLAVDADNRVVSIQPHFYADNIHEQKRTASVYSTVKLHEILESFSIAFRSYHTIDRFARKKGVEIFNATAESFIDAFKRRELPHIHTPSTPSPSNV